jgi:hypothetical protein
MVHYFIKMFFIFILHVYLISDIGKPSGLNMLVLWSDHCEIIKFYKVKIF